MIDLTINRKGLENNIARARAAGIVIPTFAQMKDPSLIPQTVLDKLSRTGLWDIDPVNLFRVSWHNEPKESGGLFGAPNFIEFTPAHRPFSSHTPKLSGSSRSAPSPPTHMKSPCRTKPSMASPPLSPLLFEL